jgi:IS5 family transposase
MRPKQPETEPQEDLFRARLANLVDPRHPLVRLAGLIDWGRFEAAFGPLYTDAIGRPGLPTRLMVGLHLLKHMDGRTRRSARDTWTARMSSGSAARRTSGTPCRWIAPR